MALDDTERDRALRAILVDRVEQPVAARGVRLQPERLRTGVVTAVVLVAIVALSVVAVRMGGDRDAPAEVGTPSAVPSTEDALPTPTVPAGKLLGRWTSADGPVQSHVIRPDGLALSTLFTCTGGDIRSQYMIHIPHYSDEGGGCNGSSGGSGNKGVAGSVTVTVRTTKAMRWTLTIVGIPETYITPKPVPSPTDSAGAPVPYCTADDLTARFDLVAQPDGVTEVDGGEVVLTNRTTATCALAGYPEIRFDDGTDVLGHHTMNHTDSRDTIAQGLSPVILRPGGRAYSQVDWYLPGANAKEEGRCVERPVREVRIDLDYDLASPGQSGSLTTSIPRTIACLNGAHGALGKYGQISSTIFVPYSLTDG